MFMVVCIGQTLILKEIYQANFTPLVIRACSLFSSFYNLLLLLFFADSSTAYVELNFKINMI